jgi:peroxiredoxin
MSESVTWDRSWHQNWVVGSVRRSSRDGGQQVNTGEARLAMPAPGEQAPNFTLPSSPEQSLTLSGLRGQPVVLAFYPADWSPVCSDELALYQAVLPLFGEYGATVLGLSVDGVWCHEAFAENRQLTFPLLADFEPKGQVSRTYGSYDPIAGESERNLFVIDPDGKVFWNYRSPDDVNPGADGILAALDEMRGPRAR